MSRKIDILSSINSPRLSYTLDFIFNQFFDCGYTLSQEYSSRGIAISYSEHEDHNEILTIHASSYLSGMDIIPDPATIDPNSDSFDLFAFVFYFLSRAEEYQFESSDSFGRFGSSDATFAKEISKPLVDIFLLAFIEKINIKFEINLERKSCFKLIHTVDIDQFYAFKNKTLIRTIGGLVSSTLKANISQLKDRTKSLTEGEDPYDTFQFLQKHSENCEALYFVLVGNYDKLDNALDITQDKIKSQLLDLAENASIGLHPSIQSHQEISILRNEKEKLASVISQKVTQSRQHYLKFQLPLTFQNLQEIGIKQDHSMAYHDAIGFRAGTSNPFYWFDLSKNEATDLVIQPLLVMDVTLKKYLDLDPATAIDLVKDLINQCQAVGAPFSLLWHNSSFYEQEGWAGWKEVYLAIINYCRELST